MSKGSEGTRKITAANASNSRSVTVKRDILEKIYKKNPTVSQDYLKEVAEKFVKEGKPLDSLLYDKEIQPITKVGKYSISTKNGEYEVNVMMNKAYLSIKGTGKSEYKSQKFYQIKKNGVVIYSESGNKNNNGHNVLAPQSYKEEFKKMFK